MYFLRIRVTKFKRQRCQSSDASRDIIFSITLFSISIWDETISLLDSNWFSTWTARARVGFLFSTRPFNHSIPITNQYYTYAYMEWIYSSVSTTSVSCHWKYSNQQISCVSTSVQNSTINSIYFRPNFDQLCVALSLVSIFQTIHATISFLGEFYSYFMHASM